MKLFFIGNNTIEMMVIDEDGNPVTGLTVTYEIRKSIDSSLFDSGTLSESSGTYYKNINFTTVGQYRAIYSPPAGYESGIETVLVREEFAQDSKMDTLIHVESGNWKIVNNQMIFYKITGEELMRFNLFDDDGVPSSESVTERRKVL